MLRTYLTFCDEVKPFWAGETLAELKDKKKSVKQSVYGKILLNQRMFKLRALRGEMQSAKRD